jgi:hypothetical protein
VEDCWFVNHPRDNRQENKKAQDWKMGVFPERCRRWLHSERIRKSGAARQHFAFGEERWHDGRFYGLAMPVSPSGNEMGPAR